MKNKSLNWITVALPSVLDNVDQPFSRPAAGRPTHSVVPTNRRLLQSIPVIELVIVAGCLWLAVDLPVAWTNSPPDRLGWLVTPIWLLPLAIMLQQMNRATAQPLFLGAAIGCGLVAEITEFHFSNHAALSPLLASWLPQMLWHAAWCLAAVAWLPWLGRVPARFSHGLVLTIRSVLSLASLACVRPLRKWAFNNF